MKKLGIIAVLGTALLLAGCGGAPSATETHKSSATTTLGKVATIDQLVKAYTKAGGVCNWKQTDVIKGAVASGECSDAVVLSIYNGTADRDAAVAKVRSLPIDVTLLVGDNWVINTADAEGLADKLGGVVITGPADAANSAGQDTFCGTFRTGDKSYLDFVSNIGANLDVTTFQKTIEPYIAKMKSLAPTDEGQAMADYASVADSISAAIASGDGKLSLNTVAYKSGALELLTYCTGKQ